MSRKPYIRPVLKTSWYLHHNRYKRYILREITCFFIGAYTIIFTIGLWHLASGPDSFKTFVEFLHMPGAIVFHSIALALSTYHSITWFNVTPQAMPIMKGEDFVPGSYIVSAHYAIWIAVSLIILTFVGRT